MSEGEQARTWTHLGLWRPNCGTEVCGLSQEVTKILDSWEDGVEAWGHGFRIEGRRRQQPGLLDLREEDTRASGFWFCEGEGLGPGGLCLR